MGGERRAIQCQQTLGRTEGIEAVARAVECGVAQGAQAGVERVLQGLFECG